MNPDNRPLAEKLRPKTLNEFVGQEHLVGKDKPIRVAIEKKLPMSFILWGPPGVGKTTLAKIYASELNLEITEMSAVSAGKEEMRLAVKKAMGYPCKALGTGANAILSLMPANKIIARV